VELQQEQLRELPSLSSQLLLLLLLLLMFMEGHGHLPLVVLMLLLGVLLKGAPPDGCLGMGMNTRYNSSM
jgi:hypothetical protein